ncbi:MAG TPA: hypothetical protein VER96_18090 [Polyangiaceae bacterium]|nr:hypothetical protein [Polyangiaceae bacterium]
MATIDFDAGTSAALDAYIASHFPDASTNADTRTGVALALWADSKTGVNLDAYQTQLSELAAKLGINQGKDSVAKAMPNDGFRYYDIASTHARWIPNEEPFVGHLSMVRVTLPLTNADVRDIQTGIGTVAIGDHMYRSVQEFKQTYLDAPYSQTTRLDLVTPPRELGVRFGAVSAYLGYTNGSATPSFYVLEAGTATGDAKVPFVCATLDGSIVAFSGYQPTPFAKKSHVYRGSLHVVGDKPDVLSITSEATAHSPYITITAKFTETTTPQNIWPGFLIVRAAAIVALRSLTVPHA